MLTLVKRHPRQHRVAEPQPFVSHDFSDRAAMVEHLADVVVLPSREER